MTIYGGYSEQQQYVQDQDQDYDVDTYGAENGEGLDEAELTQEIQDVGYEDYQAELMSRHMRREYGEQPISREQAQEYAADSDRVNEAAREEAHQCFRGNRSGRMGRGEMQERGMSRENSELVAHEYGNGESVDEQELTNAIATGDARTDGNGDFRDSSGNFQAEGAGTEESANNDEYIGTDTPVTTGAVEEPVVETATEETVVAPIDASTTEETDTTEESVSTSGVTGAESTAPVSDGSYPAGATSIELTSDTGYAITLVATPNPGNANIENITIPAGETVTVDVAELSGSAEWAGNFEIRASDTMESTGALLEYNYNANWGQGENVNFFDLSYINGVAYNSNEQDIINTVAYLPNGIVQGNENGDMNDIIGSNWDQLYDPSTGLMKPLQNGAALTDKSGDGYNLMAELMLEYREQTDSAFYLYVGTEVSNFADDEFSQGWSGDTGMKVTFY